MEHLYYQVQQIYKNYKLCIVTTQNQWNCKRILNDELVQKTKHASHVAKYRCWDQFQSDIICNQVYSRVLKVVEPYYDAEFAQESLAETLK